MRRIIPYSLWLGNARDGRDFRSSLDCGIQALMQLAAEEPALQPPRDLIYCRFPLVDGQGNDLKLLRLAVMTLANFLEQRIPLLVFCGMGLSRSPSVAAIALAQVEQEDPEECLRRITDHSPADVAPGFWNELKQVFEADLL